MALTIGSTVLVSYGQKNRQKKEGYLIVTSFYPVYIATMNVTGDIEGVEVRCLSRPAAGCVHDHQLTTEDLLLLEQADLFIMNGAGMEGYLESIMERYPRLQVVDTSRGIPMLESEEEHNHEHGEEEHDFISNAHIWMNMRNYCTQVENIGNALMQNDAIHKKEYETNMQDYQKQILALLEAGQRELKSAKRKTAVSTHEAFSYFAENFEWDMVETIHMDENTSLKASEVSEVIKTVQESDTAYVFTEANYGSSLSKVLKNETDCKIVILDTLVMGKIDKNAYLVGMRNNIDALKEASQ